MEAGKIYESRDVAESSGKGRVKGMNHGIFPPLLRSLIFLFLFRNGFIEKFFLGGRAREG